MKNFKIILIISLIEVLISLNTRTNAQITIKQFELRCCTRDYNNIINYNFSKDKNLVYYYSDNKKELFIELFEDLKTLDINPYIEKKRDTLFVYYVHNDFESIPRCIPCPTYCRKLIYVLKNNPNRNYIIAKVDMTNKSSSSVKKILKIEKSYRAKNSFKREVLGQKESNNYQKGTRINNFKKKD